MSLDEIIKGITASSSGLIIGWRVVILLLATLGTTFTYWDYQGREENKKILNEIKNTVNSLQSKELAAEEYKSFDKAQHDIIFRDLQALHSAVNADGEDIAELFGFTGLKKIYR